MLLLTVKDQLKPPSSHFGKNWFGIWRSLDYIDGDANHPPKTSLALQIKKEFFFGSWMKLSFQERKKSSEISEDQPVLTPDQFSTNWLRRCSQLIKLSHAHDDDD